VFDDVGSGAKLGAYTAACRASITCVLHIVQ
jgi:hypothetical protein